MGFLIESERRRSQLDFAASGRDFEVGESWMCPLPLADLLALDARHPAVQGVFDGGLTAIVYKVRANGRDWAVKRARTPCLVQNADGQTSFLNELQRRADLARLKAQPLGRERLVGIVDTVWASLRHGVVVSPWIDGQPITRWTPRQLQQVYALGRELLRAGLFEWDFSPGNVLDDGRQVHLFDFGYMYRFDPLRHFNSSGDGLAAPQCHLAERLETRHLFGTWLGLGDTEALAGFRDAKTAALAAYRRLHADLAADGASAQVLAWLEGIADGWATALDGDLRALWLREGWRSHVIDLEDDLGGQSCTPATLRRVDWLLDALRHHHGALAAHGAFFAGDTGVSREHLIADYTVKRAQAEGWQIRRAA